MDKILLTIHALTTVARPTVLGKWEKAQQTDKYIALWVQYIVLVCIAQWLHTYVQS